MRWRTRFVGEGIPLSQNVDNTVRGTGRLIKELNRSRILECFLGGEALSRVEVAKRTGISLPAVSHLVAEMEAQNLLVQVGIGESSGGRRPVLYAYNARMAYLVGIDLGGTKLVGGVCDMEGNVVASARVPTHGRRGSVPDVHVRVREFIESLLEDANVDLSKVMGIGIGVPGIPDPTGGGIRLAPGLRTGPPIGNVRGVASSAAKAAAEQDTSNKGDNDESLTLASYLEEHFGRPVHIDNDVNMILQGERWKGSLQHASHGVCVTVGTGIGVGLLTNGEVYRGANGAAGEIGYWLIGSLGPIVKPTGYGPLETFAAGPGIARRCKARLQAPGASRLVLDLVDGDEEAITAEVVAQAAQMGDPLALEVWHETVAVLGVALANLCSLIDPEKVIISGGVARAPKSLFLDPLRDIISTLVPFPPKVVGSQLGEHAGILGAVATVLDSQRSSISYLTSEPTG